MSFRAFGSRSISLPLAASTLLLLTVAACSDDGRAATEAFDNGEYEKAMDLWMPLADAGDAEAQFGVGFLYDEGLGVPSDGVEAIRWYRLAAEQGHETSQLNLGALYQTGRENVTPDSGRAADWFRMAALQGNPKAQYYLGKLYRRGDGLPRNYELAFEWLQKSAEQGYAKGMNLLGILYASGQGVEKNVDRAFDLVQRAAELGDSAAQLSLALMYIQGKGTERDYIEGIKWHTISDLSETPGAGLPPDWAVNNMTPEDIEEAERRAAEWLAAHPAAAEE